MQQFTRRHFLIGRGCTLGRRLQFKQHKQCSRSHRHCNKRIMDQFPANRFRFLGSILTGSNRASGGASSIILRLNPWARSSSTPTPFTFNLTKSGGRALRYNVGLGRQGFAWSGNAIIQSKQEWPKWFPPKEMIARQPSLRKYSEKNGGHPPGTANPLGARALYLYENGRDTLYRLHGTAKEASIGNAVSSGCVRLMNHDIIDLHKRVAEGTKVVVVNSRRRG